MVFTAGSDSVKILCSSGTLEVDTSDCLLGSSSSSGCTGALEAVGCPGEGR